MSFEQQWDAAAYNWLYWVSYAGMLIAPLLGATLVSHLFARRPVARRAWHVGSALLCFFLTAGATVESIGLKWQLRAQAAQTDNERQIVAMRDTGNLAFAPIIGGVCGAVGVVLWCITAWGAGRFARRRAQRTGGPSVPPNQPLEWTGPAERSS
jgi:hypothetical protein